MCTYKLKHGYFNLSIIIMATSGNKVGATIELLIYQSFDVELFLELNLYTGVLGKTVNSMDSELIRKRNSDNSFNIKFFNIIVYRFASTCASN